MPLALVKHSYNRPFQWLRKKNFPAGEFQLVSWLFLRGLGLIYFSAFVSFGVQASALIGSHGIVPVAELVGSASRQFGAERFWLAPMVFWFDASDWCIQIVCWGGVALSLLLTFNILPRLCLALLYFLYLSLIYGGQNFMTFQWDFLLVDAGFLGLLLSFSIKPGVLLLRWLLFRFMFMSGAVKLASGDISWRDFSALTYHFETQPLPTPLAWYAHHLPASVLMCLTFATLFIELVLPFFIFYGRRLRMVAAFGIVALQIVIALTGNYNFFNLLVILTCLALFDDAALRRALPKKLIQFLQKRRTIKPPGRTVKNAISSIAMVIIFATSIQLVMAFGVRPPEMLTWVNGAIAPLRVVNTYGPFAIMTTKRREIIIEGSNDRTNWKEYSFRYKPGDVKRGLPWNIPHQPRVDWQLWFAALESPSQNPWFTRFLERVLEGEPAVMDIFETNPFPDYPPIYIRAMFYDYHFSTSDEKRATGQWWNRKLIGTYFMETKLP